MRWQLIGDGVFHVHSYYTMVRGITVVFFPWKSIWCVKAPRRVSFFVWTTAWGRILIHDNLIKRGSLWWVGVVCTVVVERWLLASCDIVFGLWSRALGAYRVGTTRTGL